MDGVSFSVEHGEWVTLIGPNGAGKTSLMRAIAGLVGHRGEIRLDGDPLRALRRRERGPAGRPRPADAAAAARA